LGPDLRTQPIWLIPDEFERHVQDGYQATATWNQGTIYSNRLQLAVFNAAGIWLVKVSRSNQQLAFVVADFRLADFDGSRTGDWLEWKKPMNSPTPQLIAKKIGAVLFHKNGSGSIATALTVNCLAGGGRRGVLWWMELVGLH